MELTNVHGPEGSRGQPPIAPTGTDGDSSSSGDTSSGSTMSTANAGDEEMVTTQVSNFAIAEPAGGGSAAEAQKFEIKKDTSVQAKDVNKVKNLTEQRSKYADKKIEEFNN